MVRGLAVLWPEGYPLADMGESAAGEAGGRGRTVLKVILWTVLAFLLLGIWQVGRLMMMFNDESRAKAPLGTLGAARAALGMYKDKHGAYPGEFAALIPDYLAELPRLHLPDHGKVRAVRAYGAEACAAGELAAAAVEDSGGLGYIADAKSACFGTVFLSCTHQSERNDRSYHRY